MSFQWHPPYDLWKDRRVIPQDDLDPLVYKSYPSRFDRERLYSSNVARLTYALCYRFYGSHKFTLVVDSDIREDAVGSLHHQAMLLATMRNVSWDIQLPLSKFAANMLLEIWQHYEAANMEITVEGDLATLQILGACRGITRLKLRSQGDLYLNLLEETHTAKPLVPHLTSLWLPMISMPLADINGIVTTICDVTKLTALHVPISQTADVSALFDYDLPVLKELSVTSIDQHTPTIEAFPPSVKKLTLHNVNAKTLPELNTLDFHGDNVYFNEEILVGISLQHLRLIGCNSCFLADTSKLTHLVLSICGDIGVSRTSQFHLPVCPALKVLTINGATSAVDLTEVLTSAVHLEALTLIFVPDLLPLPDLLHHPSLHTFTCLGVKSGVVKASTTEHLHLRRANFVCPSGTLSQVLRRSIDTLEEASIIMDEPSPFDLVVIERCRNLTELRLGTNRSTTQVSVLRLPFLREMTYTTPLYAETSLSLMKITCASIDNKTMLALARNRRIYDFRYVLYYLLLWSQRQNQFTTRMPLEVWRIILHQFM